MKIFGIHISRKPPEVKVLDAAAFLRGDDGGDRGGAVLRNAYQQVVWVYAAINVLAQQVANIPFLFSSGERGRENLITAGPLLDFYDWPHPQIDRFQYWELRIIWLMLRGECFRVPIYNGRQLERVVILDPAMFQEIIRGNELIGWRYTGLGPQAPLDAQMFLPEEVWFDKLPNPFNFWRGMPPLQLASLAARTDYAAGAFMKGLMENNADTGVIVTTEQQLDETQREQILAALKERKRKAGTADRPLLLWGGTQITKPSLSSTDMQFLENRKFSRGEICAVFGVPEEIVTTTDTAKYDVMEGARLNFIENRVAPLCTRLEASERWTVQAFDKRAVGWFDIDSLPIMQNARRSRWQSAVQGFGMGVPFNELNKVFDLGAEPLPWGDVGFLPFSLQRAEDLAMAQPAAEPAPAPSPADQTQNALERMGRLLWMIGGTSNNEHRTSNGEKEAKDEGDQKGQHVCAGNPSGHYEASIQGAINALAGRMKKFFFEQQTRLLQRLPELHKEFAQVADGADKLRWVWTPRSPLSRGLDDLWNAGAEDAKLAARLKPSLIADLDFGGAQLWKEIGLDPATFKLPPADAIAFLDKRKKAISGINQTTWDKIRAALQQGLQDGDPLDALAGRVKAAFKQFSDARAESIAVTETNVATNSGRHGAMKLAKVPRKGWATSHLENTRASHIANEQLSDAENGIPIDQAWPNGLMYPGDPAGAVGETINCRCFGFAVLEP